MGASAGPTPDGQAPPRARWAGLLRHALSLAVLVFVIVPAWRLLQRWDGAAVHVNWTLVAVSVLPLVAGILVQACGWVWLVRHLSGQVVPWIDGVYIHVASQLARYVPGKIGVPIVRIGGAARHGVPKRVAATSLAVEMISWLAAGGVLGLLHLIGARTELNELAAFAGSLSSWALGFGVLGTLLLITVNQTRLPKIARRTLGASGNGPLLPKTVLATHGLYWLSWSLHGVLLMAAVAMPLEGAWARSGFFILAPVLGFVVLIAPAGVGIREAVLSIGLAAVTTPSTAIAAAVLSRGATLLADVATWGYFRATRGPLGKSA